MICSSRISSRISSHTLVTLFAPFYISLCGTSFKVITKNWTSKCSHLTFKLLLNLVFWNATGYEPLRCLRNITTSDQPFVFLFPASLSSHSIVGCLLRWLVLFVASRIELSVLLQFAWKLAEFIIWKNKYRLLQIRQIYHLSFHLYYNSNIWRSVNYISFYLIEFFPPACGTVD